MVILGIETSCDETAVSLVENGSRALSSVVSSSLHLHQKYGGVVPEIATRYHVELINYVLGQALSQAKIKLGDIDAVAVVNGPGLVGALMIGLSLAKAISFSLKLPLLEVNHVQAHLYAAFMQKDKPEFPCLGLVVSGGHTHLFYLKSHLDWQLVGKTRDDAAGEAFDKVAKILKLGYPGGPAIEKQSRCGDPDKIRFPRSYLEENSFDFSFSGLKTAVLYYVQGRSSRQVKAELADIAASFQEAVVDILARKAVQAALSLKVKSFILGGGVAMNQRLRKVLRQVFKCQQIDVYFPGFKFCQDNAAMVAGLGYQLYRKKRFAKLDLEVKPNLQI